MTGHRYILEPYKTPASRYRCPSCNRPRVFAKYIDQETREYLPDHVGRCNREVNCGYWFTPADLFVEHPELKPGKHWRDQYLESGKKQRSQAPKNQPPSYIPDQIFSRSLSRYEENNLVKYLDSLFGSSVAMQATHKYFLGTSRHWPGSTVFWQIDNEAKIRAGKVMQYDPQSGKRIKEQLSDGEYRSRITWSHTLLKQKGLIAEFNLQQCFFGEHLLSLGPQQSVGIVESEKTAILCSIYMPEFIWLACGSLTNLTPAKCRVLNQRRVVLFPDLKCLDKWCIKAEEIIAEVNCSLSVSDFLEMRAGEEDKEQGLDIADYLVHRDEKFGWALSENNYPLFWDMKKAI